MEYNIAIWSVFGMVLVVGIILTVINHRKKTKSNQVTCASCRGISFRMTYTWKPVPPCKKCHGTGYVDKN